MLIVNIPLDEFIFYMFSIGVVWLLSLPSIFFYFFYQTKNARKAKMLSRICTAVGIVFLLVTILTLISPAFLQINFADELNAFDTYGWILAVTMMTGLSGMYLCVDID